MRTTLNKNGKKMQLTVKHIIAPPMFGPANFFIGVLAVMVSWFFNKSVWWAIFHWLFGWIYLIYVLLTGGFKDGGFMEMINSYF